MACRDALKKQNTYFMAQKNVNSMAAENILSVSRLLFGVESKVPSNNVLQNNITQFEWVVRNKLHPTFWGRNLTGNNALTKEEISFLHSKACKIAAIHITATEKITEEQGRLDAKEAAILSYELTIPKGTAIFLEIADEEEATTDYMNGYADELMWAGYTPGFKANTDAAYNFDREFSRGMQNNLDVFGSCLVWAATPTLQEYDRITTSHLIHPDNWTPFAPSAINRNDIAVWQYGKDCHPIYDNANRQTSFNINLVRNDRLIIEKMF